jgi:apyrase
MLRTGSGGGGVQVAPASPGGGFARTVSSTELGGAEYVADARRTAGRQKHDRHAKSRGGALPEASRAFVVKLAVCALACLAALAALVLVGTLRGADSETRRLIVFDAGSSSTRVHVFELDVPKGGNRLPTVRAHHEAPRRASPGLAAFADTDHDDDDAQIQAYLEPLLRFAESVVPRSKRAETSTLLMATAGLRALPNDDAERLLAECRSVLRRSAFSRTFTDAHVQLISGHDEGLYAWLAANYAAGTLYEPPEKTVGVVELGGASAQVTFRPEKKPPLKYRAELVITRRKWAVYTHSALGLGLDAARLTYEKGVLRRQQRDDEEGSRKTTANAGLDPCALTGNGVSSVGDFAACRAACAELMGAPQLDAPQLDAPSVSHTESRRSCLRDSEKSEEKRAGPSDEGNENENENENDCGFGGSFLPALRGSFLLTENFAHAVRFLRDAGFLETDDGLKTRSSSNGGSVSSSGVISVARVADAGARICSTTKEELFSRLNVSFEQHRDSDGSPSIGVTDEMNAIERSIKHACFATSYVVAALADVLRVDERRNALRFGDEVRGVKVDWAVGAAIAHEARDAFEVEEEEGSETSISVSSRAIDRAFANVAKRAKRASRGVDASLAPFFFVGVVVLAACVAFARPFSFARASPSDAPRATQAQLRLGELKVRRTLGMPSKGGVTSPTKRAAGEDARKGN